MGALSLAQTATLDDALSLQRRRRSEPTHFWRPPPRAGSLGCWVVSPDLEGLAQPPLVVIHGYQRGAYKHALRFGRLAQKTGRTVVAPLFEARDWPRYQQAVRRGRADLALLALMARLAGEGTIADAGEFDLFGFSGGAQFGHRFAMLHPERVRTLSIASAGWYTFFDDARFPYGLGGKGWGEHAQARLPEFLSIPTQVLIGADDNTRDRNLRQGPEIDAQQGFDRLDRARRWTAARNRAALDLGLEATTSIKVMANCGHSFARCAAQGLTASVLAHATARRPGPN